SASLRCEETWSRYPPLLLPALGAAWIGLVAATRFRVSATGAGSLPCGTSDSGALLEAFALAAEGWLRGAAGDVFAAAAGFAVGGAADVTGVAAPSGWSPRTERVLTFRGSLFGSVPFPAAASCEPPGATLAADGGPPSW